MLIILKPWLSLCSLLKPYIVNMVSELCLIHLNKCFTSAVESHKSLGICCSIYNFDDWLVWMMYCVVITVSSHSLFRNLAILMFGVMGYVVIGVVARVRSIGCDIYWLEASKKKFFPFFTSAFGLCRPSKITRKRKPTWIWSIYYIFKGRIAYSQFCTWCFFILVLKLFLGGWV